MAADDEKQRFDEDLIFEWVIPSISYIDNAICHGYWRENHSVSTIHAPILESIAKHLQYDKIGSGAGSLTEVAAASSGSDYWDSRMFVYESLRFYLRFYPRRDDHFTVRLYVEEFPKSIDRRTYNLKVHFPGLPMGSSTQDITITSSNYFTFAFNQVTLTTANLTTLDRLTVQLLKRTPSTRDSRNSPRDDGMGISGISGLDEMNGISGLDSFKTMVLPLGQFGWECSKEAIMAMDDGNYVMSAPFMFGPFQWRLRMEKQSESRYPILYMILESNLDPKLSAKSNGISDLLALGIEEFAVKTTALLVYHPVAPSNSTNTQTMPRTTIKKMDTIYRCKKESIRMRLHQLNNFDFDQMGVFVEFTIFEAFEKQQDLTSLDRSGKPKMLAVPLDKWTEQFAMDRPRVVCPEQKWYPFCCWQITSNLVCYGFCRALCSKMDSIESVMRLIVSFWSDRDSTMEALRSAQDQNQRDQSKENGDDTKKEEKSEQKSKLKGDGAYVDSPIFAKGALRLFLRLIPKPLNQKGLKESHSENKQFVIQCRALCDVRHIGSRFRIKLQEFGRIVVEREVILKLVKDSDSERKHLNEFVFDLDAVDVGDIVGDDLYIRNMVYLYTVNDTDCVILIGCHYCGFLLDFGVQTVICQFEREGGVLATIQSAFDQDTIMKTSFESLFVTLASLFENLRTTVS